MNIKTNIEFIRNELGGIYPQQEISGFITLIFEDLEKLSPIQIRMNGDKEISEKNNLRIIEIIERLKNYEPIQYILGTAWFYDTKIVVNPNVLIPRQETEELVKWTIDEASHKKSGIRILDMCTGSGCIIVSLAKNIINSSCFGADISSKALETAIANSKNNKLDINFFVFDILKPENLLPDGIPEKFDIIVSNPPYVTKSEKPEMQKNVLDYEPEIALFVEDDEAMIFYYALADFALLHLEKKGKIFLEINEKFGKIVEKIFLSKKFNNIAVRKDINGKDRMLCASI